MARVLINLRYETPNITIPPILESIEEHAILTILHSIRDYLLKPLEYDKSNFQINEEVERFFSEGLSTIWEVKEELTLLNEIKAIVVELLTSLEYDDLFSQIGYMKDIRFSYDKRIGHVKWFIEPS